MSKKYKQKNEIDVQYDKDGIHEIVKYLIPFYILVAVLILFTAFSIICVFLHEKSIEEIFDDYYWMLLAGSIITILQMEFQQIFYEAMQIRVRLKKAEIRKFVSGMLLVAACAIMLIMHYGGFSNQEIFMKISHIFYFLGLIETGRWCSFYIQMDEKLRIKQKKRGAKKWINLKEIKKKMKSSARF